MFGLGMPEILMILAIALIVIGPKKLPDLAKTLGRAMGEFKRSAQDFKQSLDVETTIKDITDIEGITGTIDTNDDAASKPENKSYSKDSSTNKYSNNLDNLTGDPNNTNNDSDDNNNDLNNNKENIEFPENPSGSQDLNHDGDSNQQNDSGSNKKSDNKSDTN